ncbi:MAG: hypothetical protein F6J87_21445 [Spirulina sp. SIO3F2]|nr:hypothetical protein [Spirulina sp. SIO3F2]
MNQALTELQPQGMTAAAIYGLREQAFPNTPPSSTELTTLQTQPAWVNWLPLAHANTETFTVQELARQRQGPALTFLLQRCLNPDIEGFLATGGIRVKLCFRGSLLHIMTEAVVCPRQTLVVPKLEAYLQQLQIPDVMGVRIYGRRAGQSSPLWSYGSNHEALASSPVVETTVPTVEMVTPTMPTQAPASAPRWPGLRALLQQVFCLTSIFVPSPDSVWQPSTPARWHTQQGWRAAIAWTIAGVVGMGVMDWQVSVYLQTMIPTAALTPLSLETESLQTANADSGVGAAILAAARTTNPPFNNNLLDEKLALYQEQIQQTGIVPDILIVGSSRAMRGIDPEILQTHLAQQLSGQPQTIQIFNFGVNGATAQVVEFLLRRVLTPEQLPKLVLWADGARAFNSGRLDRTFEAIQDSEGYTQLEAGKFPPRTGNLTTTAQSQAPLRFGELHQGIQRQYQALNSTTRQSLQSLLFSHHDRAHLHDWLRDHLSTTALPAMSVELSPDAAALELSPQEAITVQGFLPLDRRFDPQTYYLEHSRVSGAHDSDYTSFTLVGKQLRATHRLLDYLAEQSVAVVFVNLPLTTDYLDETRQRHEQVFTEKMAAIAAESELVFRDLGQAWPNDYAAFSDPSHLNRHGAAQVAHTLVRDAQIAWQAVLPASLP